MANSTPPKEPRLHFANEKGEYIAEYIPEDHYKFADWLRDKHVYLRNYFHKDIYYWHIRHNIPTYSRKTGDIEFLLHVLKDHDREPEDRMERRHYRRAWLLYGLEVEYITSEIAKDEDTTWENDEMRLGHPYAYAYTQQWYEKLPEVETKLLYHGISYDQYASLLDLLVDRAVQRRDDYCSEHGLDPETGEKLTALDQTIEAETKCDTA